MAGAARRRAPRPRGRVVLFATCYGNRNEPDLDEDLVAVFEHNGIEVTLLRARSAAAACRKLELGDLEAVARLQGAQHPAARRG